MRDLKNPLWINVKGVLFLLLGFLAAALVFFERQTFCVAALLIVAIWSFCRFYYFAFYVLERYLDPSFRFSGLLALVRHLIATPRRKNLM